MIPCNNIKCSHYQRAEKREWFEGQIGVTYKQGTCKYGYCKMKKRRNYFEASDNVRKREYGNDNRKIKTNNKTCR